MGTFLLSLYRCHYTCSTDHDREIALKELTEQYVRNQYPRKLVEKTILEIKGRNFENKGNRSEYQELRKESPEKFYTLSIPYTSPRCEKVMSKIIRLLKNNTPDYLLNVAWRSANIQKIFSHKLKLSIHLEK